jgi:hypothetical protein
MHVSFGDRLISFRPVTDTWQKVWLNTEEEMPKLTTNIFFIRNSWTLINNTFCNGYFPPYKTHTILFLAMVIYFSKI